MVEVTVRKVGESLPYAWETDRDEKLEIEIISMAEATGKEE